MGYFPFSATGRSLAVSANAGAGRTALALGTIAVQDANAVNITGGSVAGLNTYAVYDIDVKTSDYTVQAADVGKTFQVSTASGAVTITLPALADIDAGDWIDVKYAAGGNALTVDGNASETIEGAANYVLSLGESIRIVANDDKSGWILV